MSEFDYVTKIPLYYQSSIMLLEFHNIIRILLPSVHYQM